MSNFRDVDRETAFLLPPSVEEWLPERHLARFVVEVIDGLDLGGMIGAYRGSGSAAHHPRMLLGVLIYGYATGVFSSRKLERATYDSVAFRYIAANDHPDHDTIATFRRRFLKEIEGLFVRVLLLAREMGVLKMGTVGLDGTKINANASRHSALSWEHAGKLEAQLQAEVADLLARAEAEDQADVPDGLSIPEELALRKQRLAKLAEARAKIEARAKERYERERAEHEAKLAAREAKTAATGKKPGGKPPAPPVEGPRPKDQINLTDEDSRIMPASGGGFEQAYNAQAVVAAGSLLVVAADVVQAQRQAAARTDAGQDRGFARTRGRGRNALGRHRLFQRGERPSLSGDRHRTADRHGPSAASSPAWRALREGGTRAGKSDAGRGHGPSAEDARRPQTLRFAQAHAGAGVRHHQIGARVPSIFVARPRPSARRVEPRDDGLESEADVRPRPRLNGRQASHRQQGKRPKGDPNPASQPRSEPISPRNTFQPAKIAPAKTPVRQAARTAARASSEPARGRWRRRH